MIPGIKERLDKLAQHDKQFDVSRAEGVKRYLELAKYISCAKRPAGFKRCWFVNKTWVVRQLGKGFFGMPKAH
jgi:hypothetical protein